MRQGKEKVITTTLGDLIVAALIVLAATIIQVGQREVRSSPVRWPPAPTAQFRLFFYSRDLGLNQFW